MRDVVRGPVGTLISGGADSATLAAWAAREGYHQRGLFISARERNSAQELRCARAITDGLGIGLEVVDLGAVFRPTADPYPFDVELHTLREQPELVNLAAMTSFNTSLLITAVRVVLAGGRSLLVGLHGDDLATKPALADSMIALQEVVRCTVGTVTPDEPFSFELPFRDWSAMDVIRAGLELGVDFAATWSCRTEGPSPCLTCRDCTARAAAFAAAGAPDPALPRR